MPLLRMYLCIGVACLGVVVLALSLATAYLLYKQSTPPATVGVPCAKQDPALRTGVRILAWIQLVVLVCVTPALMLFVLVIFEWSIFALPFYVPNANKWTLLFALGAFFGMALGIIAFLYALPIVALLYVRALDAPEHATTRDCTRIAPGYRRALLWLIGVMGVLVLALMGLVVGWAMQRGRAVSVGRRAEVKELYGPGKTKRRTALRTRR